MSEQSAQLTTVISARQSLVKNYLFSEQNRLNFAYQHLQDAVYSYVNAGGKSLRPAVLMFACGAVGGDELTAIPAAATVELYHTFTLVHDDIIDRDEMRRGVPTVHHDFATRAKAELGFSDEQAKHYGLTIAILAGDMQQGWAASLLPDLHFIHDLPPQLPLLLSRELFRTIQTTLINGETVDVLQSQTPFEKITEAEVLEMLWQKTGVLYEFCGRAGAAIGLKHPNLDHPYIHALGQFTGKCGIAFQIQDDILGITADEAKLGKKVGADIIEGKRTIIVLNALPKMTDSHRQFTLSILGNQTASHTDVQEVVGLLSYYGGITHAKNLAEKYVHEALSHLNTLPDSEYKQWLNLWADFIVNRDL
ncbi:MAG: polyprenyl synthetase family protein [bacterium]|nr:polyprenyl synthetase family protein [bacterium]